MKHGYLSQYFVSVVAKKLSTVEADKDVSHQHEFNGSRPLRKVLGESNDEKVQFPTIFIWMGEENEAVTSNGIVTWYDARLNHPTRSEYRLYYQTTDVSNLSRPGDTIFIARRTDDTLMIIVAAGGSTVESQLLWLFNLSEQTEINFTLTELKGESDKEVDFAVRYILDELGIEPEEPETDLLDRLLEPFNGKFPTAKEFSLFARNSVEKINPLDDPDAALMLWINQEEKLFRRLERQIVDSKLREGFASGENVNIDGFIGFSLSVQNRRKKRAGLALQYHLEEIFTVSKIKFVTEVETENKSKPDFLFPGSTEYFDPIFDVNLLTMLGAKTSCKDRWRQVLSEARRIEKKHILTLEPGISTYQTDEMRDSKLQLVIPKSIHESYQEDQRVWLLNLADFLKIVSDKQKSL